MKKFWIGLAVGALVGAGAAFLFAPQSGASTRRKLRRSFEDVGDSLNDAANYLKEQAERLGKEAQRLLDSSKSQFEEAVDAVNEYTQATGPKEPSQRVM